MFVLVALCGCFYDAARYEKRLNELTDHDGDGFAYEDDCDDTIASVYPGATESCDRVDQDCDGYVDEDAIDEATWFQDSDADSFGDPTSEALVQCEAPGGYVANALDCDDDDTNINPGAVDAAYNGMDEDCSGGDLVDVDGDGAVAVEAGGNDCDDMNAQIGPSGTEIAYDGVDQDCSGSDLNDVDGDGASGGTGPDCEDELDSVYPGAPETWANGYTDNDCDGEFEPALLTYGDSAWVSGQANALMGYPVAPLGDVEADGTADYLAAAAYFQSTEEKEGAIFLVSDPGGGNSGGLPSIVGGYPSGYFGAAMAEIGDVDGDEITDVAVSGFGVDSTRGAVWTIAGAALMGCFETPVDTLYMRKITGDTAGEAAGSALALLPDPLGDGTPYLAVGAYLADADGFMKAGTIAFFPAADSTDARLADATTAVSGQADDAGIGTGVQRAGDVDGDGTEDYLISAQGDELATVMPGGILDPDLERDHLFRLRVTPSETHGSCRMIGDIDGDGGLDLGCVANGLTFLTDLAAGGSASLADASSVFGADEGGTSVIATDLGDLNSDGFDETLFTTMTGESTTSTSYVLDGRTVSLRTSVRPEDVSLVATSSRDGAYYGLLAVLVGDVDGDGYDDLAMSGPQDSSLAAAGGGVVTIPIPH